MKTLFRLFGCAETPMLLFGIGLFLFTWPFLGDAGASSLAKLYSFLFVSWLVLIAGAALTALTTGRPDSEDRE